MKSNIEIIHQTFNISLIYMPYYHWDFYTAWILDNTNASDRVELRNKLMFINLINFSSDMLIEYKNED
jgi:hypothetical protein